MRDLFFRTRSLVLRFRRILIIVVQVILIVASNRMAVAVRFDGRLPGWALISFWQMLPWLVAVRALTFVPFRLYEGLWRYTSIYDLKNLVSGVAVSSLLFIFLVHSPIGPAGYPRSVHLIDAVFLILMLGAIRTIRRAFAEFRPIGMAKKVLIFGAGDAGELIVRDMRNNRRSAYYPIGFVDDDPAKQGWRIHGVPVLGSRDDLSKIFEEQRPDEVLIAIPRADAAEVRSIIRTLQPFAIPIKTLPNLGDILDGNVEVNQIRNVSVEDLLSRAPVGLDRRPLKHLIAGRRVMVTGAGGSIGSELCRQIAELGAASLLMFDRYENSLHEIHMELKDRRLASGAVTIVGDVTDASRVGQVFDKYRPEIIFHAAAHKHVPLMEDNPCEAVKNNVRGTRILARAAERGGVDRFILISTDKAVNPTSVMGSSKRLAEMVVQAQAQGSGTSFSIVRFGNVLGSNGSVLPRFMEQIRKGGPVTVTHPEMRRFFMLIPEAVQLVLHAAAQAENGVTYVLEMGEPIRLVDMVRDLIRLHAAPEHGRIEIEFVGIRPGEKLSEELVRDDETIEPSATEKILCVRSATAPSADFLSAVESLESDAIRGYTQTVSDGIQELLARHGDVIRTRETARPPVEPVHVPRGRPCPHCSADRLSRSRSRNTAERLRKQFTKHRLFRCEACGWRGWLMPVHFGPDVHESAEMPDLSDLDRAIAAPVSPSRPGFSPRDLP